MKAGIDPDTEKYFKKIIGSSERMQMLITDLLSFSRHSTNSSDFVKTDLSVLVKEAMAELEIEIENTHAQITISNMPMVYVIPSLMRQLFYNLLNNAIKFRKQTEEPVININADVINTGTTNNKMFYKVTVTDNGIGFDPKYAEDIFVVFKRLHSYHEFEGSGVGLSICKKIIEKHHGIISAESIPGTGSSFVIGLPETQPAY
jgi:hypothetical protein